MEVNEIVSYICIRTKQGNKMITFKQLIEARREELIDLSMVASFHISHLLEETPEQAVNRLHEDAKEIIRLELVN